MEQFHQDHFPVDKDAPVIEKRFLMKDYIVFSIIAAATLITVSMSIYILFSKYL